VVKFLQIIVMNDCIKSMVLYAQVIIMWKVYALLSALFNLLLRSTQKLFKKNLCNQSSHYEKHGWFLLLKEAITCYSTTLFTISKEWDTKEGTGKSMKNALQILR